MVGMAKGMTAFAFAKIQRGFIRFVTFFHELLAVVLASSQFLSLFVYAHECFESITTCIAWPKGWEGFGLPGSIEPLAIPMANIPDFARGVVFVADRLWRAQCTASEKHDQKRSPPRLWRHHGWPQLSKEELRSPDLEGCDQKKALLCDIQLKNTTGSKMKHERRHDVCSCLFNINQRDIWTNSSIFKRSCEVFKVKSLSK